MQRAVTKTGGVELLERRANGPRSERFHARVDGADVEVRVVKAPFARDAEGFLSRTEVLAQLSHPSLRMVRGGALIADGRPAAVLSLVDWTPLSAAPRQATVPLLDMGLELAEGLAALHQAGLVMGVLDADDIYPGQPAVLDASLSGLSQDGDTPQDDVKMLAQALLLALGGGPEAAPLEALFKRARSEDFSAERLVKELTALRPRFVAGAAASEVEVVEPELAGTTLSHWAIEGQLGEGAMARVYLATDVRSGAKAALKVLKQEHVGEPEFVQRFIQEVRAVEAIENPHIVTVTDFGDLPLPSGRCVFCVMEVLEGSALSDAMTREAFGVVRATRIAQQTARALQAAHEIGVVHRDVKPENLFLTQVDGREFVKVLDFGIAKLLKPLGDLPKVGTKAGIVVGTPEYMAPEQALGTGTDARVDVYAVGLVLYELLTGEQPFKGDTFGKLVLQIAQSPVPDLPPATREGERLPPGLAAVVLRCLEKLPKDRFASAADLALALEPFATPRRTLDRMPTIKVNEDALVFEESELEAAVRPSRAPLIIAAVVVLGLLGGAAAFFLGGERPAPVPPPAPVVEAPVVAAEIPKTVMLDVKSTPSGAQVKEGEVVLGVTPLHVPVARTEVGAVLTLELPKHVSQTRPVVFSQDVALSVELVAEPPPVVAPKKAAPKQKPGKRR